MNENKIILSEELQKKILEFLSRTSIPKMLGKNSIERS